MVEESNEQLSDSGSVDSGTNKPINLNAHLQNYLAEDEEDTDDDQNQMEKHEMIYNMGGEAGKSSITAYELYRFMEWVATTILAVLLTVWAFVPEAVLQEKIRFIQFPNRYYLLAVGNWLGVTLLYGEIMFHAVSMMKTHPRESYLTLVDKHTRLLAAPKRAQGEQSRRFAEDTQSPAGQGDFSPQQAKQQHDTWSESADEHR